MVSRGNSRGFRRLRTPLPTPSHAASSPPQPAHDTRATKASLHPVPCGISHGFPRLLLKVDEKRRFPRFFLEISRRIFRSFPRVLTGSRTRSHGFAHGLSRARTRLISGRAHVTYHGLAPAASDGFPQTASHGSRAGFHTSSHADLPAQHEGSHGLARRIHTPLRAGGFSRDSGSQWLYGFPDAFSRGFPRVSTRIHARGPGFPPWFARD